MKTFTFSFLMLFSSLLVNSQITPCQIDASIQYDDGWGVSPTASQGLDTAFLGQIYEQTLHFKAPETAGDVAPNDCSPFCGWSMVEASLVSIDGIETTGMSNSDLTCVPPNCTWQAGEDGCLKIYGIPSVGGHHNIWIKMQGTADGGIFGSQTDEFTIHDYFIYVDVMNSSKIALADNINYTITQKRLEFDDFQTHNIKEVMLYNLQGKHLLSSAFKKSIALNVVKGTYLLSLHLNDKVYSDLIYID